MFNRLAFAAVLLTLAFSAVAHASPFGSGPFGSGPFDAAPPAPRTPAPLLGVIGDSRAYQGSKVTTGTGVTSWHKRPMAFPVWVEIYSGGRLRFSSTLNAAVGGTNTSALQGQLDALLAQTDKPTFIAILSSINDFYQGARPEAAWANYAAVLASIRASGITPICVMDLTHDAAATTATQTRRSYAFNQIMRTEGPQLGCIVVDANADLSDSAGNPLAGYMLDGVHTTPAAASQIGRDIWNAIASTDARWAAIPPVYSQADQFDAADNPRGNLLANPLFLTSGGASSGAGASGTVAAGWTSQVLAGTGTVVASLVSRADGPGQCQRLVLANLGAVEFRGTLTRTLVYTFGGSVWLAEDLKVSAATGLIELQPTVEDTDGVTTGDSAVALEPPTSGATTYPFPSDFAGRVSTDDLPPRLGQLHAFTSWGLSPGGSATIDICAAELRRR